MKYLRTYEGLMDNLWYYDNTPKEKELTKSELKKELELFYFKYDEFMVKKESHIKWLMAKLNKIPELFSEEYSKLYFYYSTYNINIKNKQILNFVKNNVKREALKSIITKLNNQPDSYDYLKSGVEEYVDYKGKISRGSPEVKYTLMIFLKALMKSNRYLMELDAEKYNL